MEKQSPKFSDRAFFIFFIILFLIIIFIILGIYDINNKNKEKEEIEEYLNILENEVINKQKQNKIPKNNIFDLQR